jgi:hypothetical protein
LKKSPGIVSADNNILLLKGPMISRMASFAGVNLSTPELDDMAERSRYHSKNRRSTLARNLWIVYHRFCTALWKLLKSSIKKDWPQWAFDYFFIFWR